MLLLTGNLLAQAEQAGKRWNPGLPLIPSGKCPLRNISSPVSPDPSSDHRLCLPSTRTPALLLAGSWPHPCPPPPHQPHQPCAPWSLAAPSPALGASGLSPREAHSGLQAKAQSKPYSTRNLRPRPERTGMGLSPPSFHLCPEGDGFASQPSPSQEGLCDQK